MSLSFFGDMEPEFEMRFNEMSDQFMQKIKDVFMCNNLEIWENSKDMSTSDLQEIFIDRSFSNEKTRSFSAKWRHLPDFDALLLRILAARTQMSFWAHFLK